MGRILQIEDKNSRDFCSFCKAAYLSPEDAFLENCVNNCIQEAKDYKPKPEILALVDQEDLIRFTTEEIMQHLQILMNLGRVAQKVNELKTIFERFHPQYRQRQELKKAVLRSLGEIALQIYQWAEVIGDDTTTNPNTFPAVRAFMRDTNAEIERIESFIDIFSVILPPEHTFPTEEPVLDIGIFPVYIGENSSSNRVQVLRSSGTTGEPIGVYYRNNRTNGRRAGIVMWFVELNDVQVGTFILHRGDCIGRVISVSPATIETRQVPRGQLITVYLDMHRQLRYDPLARNIAQDRANQRFENSDRNQVERIGIDGIMRLRATAPIQNFVSIGGMTIPVGTIVRRDDVDIGVVAESSEGGIILEIDISSPVTRDIGLRGSLTTLTMMPPFVRNEVTLMLEVSGGEELLRREIMRREYERALQYITEEFRARNFREASVVPVPRVDDSEEWGASLETQIRLRDIEELLGLVEPDFVPRAFHPISFTERFVPRITTPNTTDDMIRGLHPVTVIQDELALPSPNLTLPDDATIGTDAIDTTGLDRRAEIAQDTREPEVSEEERTYE